MKFLILLFIFPLLASAERDCAREALSMSIAVKFSWEIGSDIDNKIFYKELPKNLKDLCKNDDSYPDTSSSAGFNLSDYKISQEELRKNKTMTAENFPTGNANMDHLPPMISNEDLCLIVDKNLKDTTKYCETPESYLRAAMKSNLLEDVKQFCVTHIEEVAEIRKRCRSR